MILFGKFQFFILLQSNILTLETIFKIHIFKEMFNIKINQNLVLSKTSNNFVHNAIVIENFQIMKEISPVIPEQ